MESDSAKKKQQPGINQRTLAGLSPIIAKEKDPSPLLCLKIELPCHQSDNGVNLKDTRKGSMTDFKGQKLWWAW